MATNATINHLAFHGTGYELVNDTLNVTVFSSQGTSESIPSYAKASTTQDGLMSKEDKAKLDDFKTADQYVTVVSGKDLSTNDFTNEYKTIVDSLKSNPPTVDTSQFVKKDGTKVLSTNDYTTADKTKLDGIEANANNFILTKATSSSLGGVKVSGSDGLKMDGEEIKISFYGASGRNTGGDASILDMSGGAGSTKGGAGGKINMSGYSVLNDTGNHHGGNGGTIFAGGGDATTASGNAFGGDGGTLILSGGKATGTSGVIQGKGGIIDISPNGTIKGNVVFTGTPVFNNGIESAKASTSQNGLMSKEDYSKLSNIEANANNFILTKATSSSLGGVKVSGHDGLTMDNDTIKISYGVGLGISPQYNLYLKRATDTEKGGVIITGNDGLTMDGETLKANIPTASPTVKGGAKIGNGLTMSNDTVQVSSSLHLYNSDGSAGTLKLQHRTTYGVGGVLDISATNADAGSIKADGQHGGVVDLTGVHNGGVIKMTGDSGGSIDASGNNYGGVIDLTGSSSGGTIKGNVVFTDTPTFSNGVNGLNVPIASSSTAGIVKPNTSRGLILDTISGDLKVAGFISNAELVLQNSNGNGGTIRLNGDSVSPAGNLALKGVNGGQIDLNPVSEVTNGNGGIIYINGKGTGKGGIIDISPNGTIKGNVVFTGTPVFNNGASGISSGSNTVSASNVYLSTSDYDTIMVEFATVASS